MMNTKEIRQFNLTTYVVFLGFFFLSLLIPSISIAYGTDDDRSVEDGMGHVIATDGGLSMKLSPLRLLIVRRWTMTMRKLG